VRKNADSFPDTFSVFASRLNARVLEKQGIFEKQGTRGNVLLVSREGVSCTKARRSWYTTLGRVPRRDCLVHENQRLSVVTPSLHGYSRELLVT
jgi:hypothetical protein